jgi:hypothetical protein
MHVQTCRVTSPLNLPAPCVLVLAGPGAAGKTTWAATHFPPESVVGSDQFRALVGAGEDDLAASADAFALLDQVVARSLRQVWPDAASPVPAPRRGRGQ